MSLKRKCRVSSYWHYVLAIGAALASGLALAAPASASATLAPAMATTTAAATTSATASSTATTTTSATARARVEVCGQGPAVVRPTSMILTCADNGERATKLHWTSWTADKATATGTVIWRACTAKCADSKRWDHTSADYTLSDPTRVAGKGVLLTRLQLHVTGATPRGFMRDLAFDESPVSTAAPRVTGRGHGVRPMAASGSLGYAAIEGYWLYAGGPDGSSGGYTDAQIAAAITGAESSFLPGIIQPGVDYCGSGADRAGWGLWQITCGNSVPQYGTDFQVLDPWNNAEEAVYKCKQDEAAGYNCFAPWSTWASGAYEQYLSTAGPDMNIGDPGEYVQINSTPPGTPSSPGPAPGSTYGPPMPNTRVAGNLLKNGSFDPSATGWDRFVPSGVTVNVSHYEVGHGAPAAAHDGSWYLATNTNGAGGAVYQDVTVNAPAGASYVATAWLSAQSTTASGKLCLWGLGSPGTNNCESYNVKAGTYTEVQVVYDLPAAYSQLRFQIYPTPNGGTTDIDTTSLVRNLLKNGSFDPSATGWDRFVPSGVTVNDSHYEVGHGAPAAAHDGSWYLATNTNGAGGAVYQDVTVNAPAGASYVATAWLSAQSTTASGKLCLWGLASPGTNNCEPYNVKAGTYTKVQLVYNLPAAYSQLRFQIYPTPNGGTSDIDTTSVVQSSLPNGSFDSSATGWSRFIPSGVTVHMSHYEVGHGAPAAAHDGSWYLATNTNGAGGAVYEDVTVNAPAGASYVATAWLSAQSTTASGKLCLWGLASPATNNCESYNVKAGTYTEVQLVYDLPAAHSQLRFQIYPTPNGGTVDIDTTSIS